MFHYVLTINSGPGTRFGLFVAITAVLSLSVWAHIASGDSALHQIVFGSMTVAVGFRTYYLLGRLVTDRALRSKLRKLGKAGYRE
jgi:dihydroceramidase